MYFDFWLSSEREFAWHGGAVVSSQQVWSLHVLLMRAGFSLSSRTSSRSLKTCLQGEIGTLNCPKYECKELFVSAVCGPVINWALVQGVTLPAPNDSLEKTDQPTPPHWMQTGVVIENGWVEFGLTHIAECHITRGGGCYGCSHWLVSSATGASFFCYH